MTFISRIKEMRELACLEEVNFIPKKELVLPELVQRPQGWKVPRLVKKGQEAHSG